MKRIVLIILYQLKWILDFIFQYVVQFYGFFITGRKQTDDFLLVIHTDGVGDYIMRIDLIDKLREMPGIAEIHHVLHSHIESISDIIHPNDKKFYLDHERYRKNYFYRFRFLKRILVESYSIVIYPVYSRSSVGDEIVKMVRAQRKISFSGDDKCMTEIRRRRNLSIYTDLISCETFLPEFQKFSLILNAVKRTSKKNITYIKLNDLYINEEILSSKDLQLPVKPLEVLLFPVSKSRIKSLPEEMVERVVHYLIGLDEVSSVRIVLGKEKNDELHNCISQMSSNVKIVTGCSLRTVFSLIHSTSLVVSVDSGPAHIAMILGKPTVVLLGGMYFGRYFPVQHENLECVYHKMDCFQCEGDCPYNEPECLTRLDARLVAEKVRTLLHESSHKTVHETFHRHYHS